MSPRPGTSSSSQLTFTAWLCLGISKPGSHFRSLYSSGRVAPGKTPVRPDLGLHHLGNPRANAPSGQLQPCQSTTTLPTQSWSSTEGRGWWALVRASPCSWLNWVNSSCLSVNSNRGSTTRGGCTQPTQSALLKDPAWVMGEAVPLDPTGHLLH